jgi:hypothetical protein
MGLRIEILIALQFIRLPLEGLLHWAAYHRQTPLALTFYGGSAELFFAITTPLVFYMHRRNPVKNRMWMLIWCYMGVASLITLWLRSLFCAPSTIQNWGFEIPNYLMVHFPGSWIATVIIPILIFAQLAAAAQASSVARKAD